MTFLDIYQDTTKRYLPAVLNACPLVGTGEGEPPGGVTAIDPDPLYAPITKAPAVTPLFGSPAPPCPADPG